MALSQTRGLGALLYIVVSLLAPSSTLAQTSQAVPCPECEPADTTPPDIFLLSPGSSTPLEFPLIRFQWCDFASPLNASSRRIFVNGLNRTSSLDYTTTGGVECSPNEAYSKSTTVSLNVGENSVSAIICDVAGNCGNTTFVITRVVPGAPHVALRNHNGDQLDRGLCLTTGGGEATAVQCGDLLVAHRMPGYRTMGRDRALTLVYNSATAVPRPRVAAWVTLPSGVQQPDSVYAELQIAGMKRASAWYTAWSGANPVRQIVLAAPFDTASGIYPFTLVVRNQYSSGVHDATQTGSLIVVNRSASEFGAGWWLAGLEQLVTGQSGNRILWMAGDGSAAVYDSIAPGVWRRALGAFRDSLVRFDSAGTWYRRTLRHRVQVTFNSAGRHVRTTNRLGHSTFLTYGGDTLKTITVPPANQAATTYTLTWVPGAKLLDGITDPAGRVLDATISGGNLTGLTDPDTIGVSFAYDGSRRLTGRTNRRGYTTLYSYANNLRVTKVEVPLTSQADRATTNITHWDERGLGVGNVTGRLTPADTTSSNTQVDGPRTDVQDIATFWVDRWGAPVKTRDPLGHETVLKRGDPANPALVTRMQFADGRIQGAGYDARGNIAFSADSTYEGTGAAQTVTTSYLYNNPAVPDSPTEVRTPVDTARFTYDEALGLLDTAIAPGGHRTRFEYHLSGAARGLLFRVTELSVMVYDTVWLDKSLQNLPTTFAYDAWGNDTSVTTPSGRRTTQRRDSYRRVDRVTDPGGHRTDFAYDSLNRITATTANEDPGLVTRYFYSSNSTVTGVWDPRNVKTSWEYDAADRPERSKDEQQNIEQQFFNRASLVDSVRTRDQVTIRHRYDAAGRLTATVYPPLVYVPLLGAPGPDTIPGDSLAYTYDGVGRMLTISRSNSTITRSYNREGTIRTERQLLRDAFGTTVSDVTMRYWYDAGDRRAKFFNGSDTLRYTYGAAGMLSTLAVQWPLGQAPDTFRFYWDGMGRRDSLVYSIGTYVSFGYDVDGRLRMVCSQHPSNPNGTDYLEQRLRYQAVNADGMVTDLVRYAGGGDGSSCGSIPLGATQVEASTLEYDERHQVVRDATHRYDYDRSGNRVAVRSLSSTLLDSLWYAAGSNRVGQRVSDSGAPVRNFFYGRAGARWSETSVPLGTQDRLYYYNALGQMTGQRWVSAMTGDPPHPVWSGGPTQCKYDALGRRTNACGAGGGGWLSFDGNNVVRGKAGFTEPIWRFVHGPGLDDPLVAMYYGGQEWRKHYYVTDGGGRHLAFTDSTGKNFMEPASVGGPEHQTYYQNGGNQAGSVENSHSFQHARSASANTPEMGFYRNRYYDQRTGQFIQEDPIGIAGGVNLYQFAGNNPVMFTDPFGLCEKAKTGSEGKQQEPTDCEKFAQYVESLAKNTKSDAEFIRILGEQIAGFPGGNSEVAPQGVTPQFGSSGFRSELVDDRNPARHYVAYLAVGFQKGGLPGAAIAVGRELPGVCGGGCSVEDIRLGVIGASHGASLRPNGQAINYGVSGPSRFDIARLIREQL